MILRHGLSIAAVGAAVGVMGALVLARLMTSLLYEVHPNDPVTFVGVTVTLLLIALMASYVPARRATKVAPSRALRAQ
jgi:putative ABC transport system permease protein